MDILHDLGCWVDDFGNRTIGRSWHFKSAADADAIAECHNFAKEKGWEVFAVGYNVECFSSADAETTYQRYGPSTGCSNGVGAWDSLQVYKICPGPGY